MCGGGGVSTPSLPPQSYFFGLPPSSYIPCPTAFQTDEKLHLILDYARGGELFTHHSQHGQFKESEARVYIAELVLALEHLHELGIIYRDIKLENILLDDQGHVLMTDFGLSKEMVHTKVHDEDGERTYSYVGTVEYMAPEIADRHSNESGHTKAVDWWSLGILLFELVRGRTPFVCDDDRQVLEDIQNKEPEYPSSWSANLVDLIQQLLIKNPRKRIGYGPSGAQAIRSHAFFSGLNWEHVRDKKISPPFLPVLKGELDTDNFDQEFTEQAAVILPSNKGKMFRGFSFVAPSVLYGGTALFNPPLGKEASALGGATKDMTGFFSKYELKEDVIGTGAFSICKKCINRETKEEFACKIVSKSKCDRDPQLEIDLLKNCTGAIDCEDIVAKCALASNYTFFIFVFVEGFYRHRQSARSTTAYIV